MKTNSQKTQLLGTASVPRALLAMGLPTMMGMLINALYNLADAFFVSSLGERQMGAISIVYPLGQVIVGLGLLFGSGAASYLSRLLGQGNNKQADKAASTALFSSLFIGSAMILLCLLFLKPILILLGATESILPYAMTYAGIYAFSCIFNVFNVTMNSIVTSEGAAKTTMCALLTGAVLNIVLDPIFIYTFHFGVAGAAIATAFSQFLSALVYAVYLLKKKSIYQFRLKDCSFSKEIFSEIFKIGIPTLVFQLLTSLSISLINHAASVYGDSAIAGLGVATRLLSMGSLTVFGFIKGFQPITGYSYGAKKYRRLRQAVKTSILWSTLFCTASGLSFALFPSQIVSLFAGGNKEMLRIGAAALRVSGITFLPFGFYTVYSSLFLALGKGKEGFFLGACRQGFCFLPAILLLPSVWGLKGILYAQPMADILSVLVTVLLAFPLHRQLLAEEALIE